MPLRGIDTLEGLWRALGVKADPKCSGSTEGETLDRQLRGLKQPAQLQLQPQLQPQAPPQLSSDSIVASGRLEVADVRRHMLLTAKQRVAWVLLIFVALTMMAVMRITWLGIGEGLHAWSVLSTQDRGEITDRNGLSLARDFPAYALWFNPHVLDDGTALVKSPREIAEALVRIFPDENVNILMARLTSGRAGYLRHRILPEDANRIHALGEPALEFPRESERFYPQGSLAANVLGYVASDGHGRVGMEQVFDHALVDASSRANPQPLSIDARVQGALEDELASGMAAAQARGAAGVVMDADTGEILALASLPSFNPNLIDVGGAAHIFNRATNEVYELGSVMKPITVAAAIDDGVITDLARRYPSGAPIKIAGFEIHDDKNFGPSLDIPEALVHSSNIVLAQVGDQLGASRLRATMEALHFNRRPAIEFPARGLPLWPHGDIHGDWSRVTTMTVSFGHGLSITPLHLASAYAALVNGGIWRPATLRRLAAGDAPAGVRIWKPSTSAKIRQLLRAIVVDGTGRKADAAGFRVGGKTGTAEIGDRTGYHKRSVIATFAAAFPMDQPRYVVVVSLVEPKATSASSYQRTAAWNAAPIVGRLIPRIGPLMGIMPDTMRDIDISDITPLIANGEGE